MFLCMRTTLTLDDDVAAAIERLRRARDASLKDIVNEALRQGLSDLTTRPKQREPFKTKNVALGRLRLASIDNISESLAVAESEAFK
jgi:predicted transcriptional regulator